MSKDTKRKRRYEGNSQTVKHKGRDPVRISRESKRARGTYKLSSTKGGTN